MKACAKAHTPCLAICLDELAKLLHQGPQTDIDSDKVTKPAGLRDEYNKRVSARAFGASFAMNGYLLVFGSRY